jgi:hypothetical protein
MFSSILSALSALSGEKTAVLAPVVRAPRLSYKDGAVTV